MLVALLFAQPYLVVRLIAQIRPVRPGCMRIALLGAIAAWEAVVLLPPVADSTARRSCARSGSLFAVVYFFAVELGAAAWFARDSRRRYGVARLRMASAAIATGLFGASILIAGLDVGIAVRRVRRPPTRPR